jgi:hypothetical protein
MDTQREVPFKRIVEVRASSWGRLFDCSYAWEGEHLLGLRRPSGLRASLGTAIHASTAAFDQARIDGRPISISDAADVFIQTLHNPTDDVDYKQDRSITMREAEQIGLTLHAKYCAEISPRYEFKAVEMKMDPLDLNVGDNMIIRLKGTMDRARVAKGGAGAIIPDIKTGARLFADNEVVLKGRSAQLGAYQLMYESNTQEVTEGAQIIALQTTAAAQAGVSRIFDARRVMLGTKYEPGLIDFAGTIFKTGHFQPNPQSSLCSEKFCARWNSCIYRDA